MFNKDKYVVRNMTVDSYVIAHNYYNGIYRTPESISMTAAKRLPRKEAQKLADELNTIFEFKKYTIELVRN